jgi:tRNA threonylcarbamoyladenosine biosynthesis protein TsaB
MPSIHKFLAIETSTSPGSVAAGTLPSHHAEKPESRRFENFLVKESQLPKEGGQGRNLMPTLVATVESAGWSLNKVDLVVVATGPGPFTGLRVGVTTAKALAWTNGCSLVGISTASCLATQAVAECGSCDQVEVIFDAGRGELYVATASQPIDNLIWQISKGTIRKPADWRKTLAPDSLVTGPGLAMQHDVIHELNDNPGTLKLPPAPAWQPYVRTLLCIGLAAVEKGITTPPAELAPTYLRASYAEDRSRT